MTHQRTNGELPTGIEVHRDSTEARAHTVEVVRLTWAVGTASQDITQAYQSLVGDGTVLNRYGPLRCGRWQWYYLIVYSPGIHSVIPKDIRARHAYQKWGDTDVIHLREVYQEHGRTACYQAFPDRSTYSVEHALIRYQIVSPRRTPETIA